MAGRPTKLTTEVSEIIIRYLRHGAYLETAAQAAGIDRRTLYAWLRRGEAERRGRYHDFAAAAEEAMAQAELGDLLRIESAAANGMWQAAAWRLERRHPDSWGRRDRLEHSGGVSLNVNDVLAQARERSRELRAERETLALGPGRQHATTPSSDEQGGPNDEHNTTEEMS